MTRFVNNMKTAIFLGGMFGLILLIGAQFGKQGLVTAFLIGGGMNIVAFFFSDRIAITAMRGQQVDESTAPDLVHLVGRLARNGGLPMPRVYICPQQAPNAFATGRSPKHAAVAITRGALELLTYEELEGVMAHELAHVKNRDTLISSIAATIAGAISALGWMMLWFGNRDNMIASLAMAILAPIAAGLIQMAISRSREFIADEDGARLAGTPTGLINALRKLDARARQVPLHNGQLDAQNHLFIVQPLTGASAAKLFSTHPSTEERIAKLQTVA